MRNRFMGCFGFKFLNMWWSCKSTDSVRWDKGVWCYKIRRWEAWAPKLTCKPGQAYHFTIGRMRYCGAFWTGFASKAKIEILSDKSITGKHWTAERAEDGGYAGFQTDKAVRQTTRAHKSAVNVVWAIVAFTSSLTYLKKYEIVVVINYNRWPSDELSIMYF